jgi:hypothetical protein
LGIRVLEQDRWDTQPREDSHGTIVRTGKPAQESLHRKPAQKSRHRKAGTGQPKKTAGIAVRVGTRGQDDQNLTARTGIQDRTTRMGLL